MNLELIPICNDQGHDIRYKYNDEFYCVICNNEGTSYRCINCEYCICSKCHRNLLKKEKEKLSLLQVSTSELDKIIRQEQIRIDTDGLFDWIVRISKDKELYYYNGITKGISYDYPITAVPDVSPETILKENSLSPEIILEEILPENNPEIEDNNFIFRIMKCVRDRWIS